MVAGEGIVEVVEEAGLTLGVILYVDSGVLGGVIIFCLHALRQGCMQVRSIEYSMPIMKAV